jgi:hypothetical protein
MPRQAQLQHRGTQQHARTSLSNTVQRELDRRSQSYATGGDDTHRQSLYDWAVTGAPPRISRGAMSSDDSEGEIEAMSTVAPNADPGARRDLQRLERALQSYRSARNALRSSRADGTAMGAVPTASALRAYWEEDDDAVARSFRRGGFPDRYQRDSVPAHAQSARATNEPRFVAPVNPKKVDAFSRVRKLIRYLSELRDTGVEGGLQAARRLGLDSLYAPDDSSTPSDLPMHVDSLPIPQYSSWLQPGMTWHGLQSTEKEPVRNSAVLASNLRRERQRELFRRTLARRRGETLRSGREDFAQGSAETVLDAERYLSDLLQDSNGRWSFSQRPTTSLSSHPTRAPYAGESDRWPVSVTIGSIDWETMTLTGKMSASHMPDKMSALHQSTSSQTSTSSMSSFFTGEIIDFRRQPIETEKEGRDYEVGGLDVDARYWQRLGPFKQEIERVRHLRGKKRSEYQQHSPLWEAFRKAAGQDGDAKETQPNPDGPVPILESRPLEDLSKTFESEEDREIEADRVMARCLGSAKWLEEKMGREWILMRWKERCFVTPSGTSTNSNPTRTILTARPSSASGSTAGRSGSTGSTSWGLTISGFYYIALNRLTGEIDGLYYDPGSQPYQALQMRPEGTPVLPRNLGHPHAAACGCGERSCREPVGLKKWFPAMELR